MFKLRLEARQCLCCGICMDVCTPRAIAMRSYKKFGLEGPTLSYLVLNSGGNAELPPSVMSTFPYMAEADRCDGYMLCVSECPTSALDLRINQSVS
jgi:Pyruvate/2-oxoacid:ferredoxin oxidoreductase delta subunit